MTKTTDLKQEIHKDLIEIKEKERSDRIKANSSLDEVTLYTRLNNPACEMLRKHLKSEGIKFNEKEVTKEILATVQMNSVPIIKINDIYLVQGRDFMNAQSCSRMLLHIAHPDYVIPNYEDKLAESIKNLQHQINKGFQHFNAQLQPIIKILSSLSKLFLII